MDIYAIGHSNYSLEKLTEMLSNYGIEVVVDIRQTPYSKYNTQFNKEALIRDLKNLGYTYIYMGKELGASREDRLSYNIEGYADFEKVINEKSFKKGIERIKTGIKKGYKIAILGAMQEPIRCHRAILVGRYLTKEGVVVKYIMHEGDICFQEDIENQLLDKYFSERNQLTIDDILNPSQKTNYEMIEEGYRLANKDIGYRTEGIKEKI